MEKLISKLQYKTCEKGEYYEEKERNLEETIELVNIVPDPKEQYAEVDLTGLSVTIIDQHKRFLKIRIGYIGAYALNYIGDIGYFKYETTKLSDVYEKIAEFFDGKIDLRLFTKQFFSKKAIDFFETKSFDYQNKFWRVILLNRSWLLSIIIYSGLLTLPGVRTYPPFVYTLVIIDVFYGYVIANILYSYYNKRGQHLTISKGNDDFFYGDFADQNIKHAKKDIKRVVTHTNRSNRNPNRIEVFDIELRDTSVIRFTNALMNTSVLKEKFSNDLEIEMVTVQCDFFSLLKLIT